MDAVEYLKARRRMCVSFGNGCDGCPFKTNLGECDFVYEELSPQTAAESVAAVEKWAKEHPVKTRQSEILKVLPCAPVNLITGVLDVCPKGFTRDKKCLRPLAVDAAECVECKKEFWLTEIEEKEK